MITTTTTTNSSTPESEYVPESPPQHGSPPYTLFRGFVDRGAPKLDMAEVRNTKPGTDNPTSYSPIQLPNSCSPPYSPTIQPSWGSPWPRPPPGNFRVVRFASDDEQPAPAPRPVRQTKAMKHPRAVDDFKRTPEGGSDVDDHIPVLRWGSPPIHLQFPPRELRKRKAAARTPSPLRLNDSDDEPRRRHGRQKQQVQAASGKAPPLNFFVVGRRTLRTLTNTAATMLTDLICKETMP
jgi:hypothetical protein